MKLEASPTNTATDRALKWAEAITKKTNKHRVKRENICIQK
jgi:hypothetical protein